MRQIICFYLNLQYQALFGLLTAPLEPVAAPLPEKGAIKRC